VLIVLLIVPGGLGALVIRVRDQLAFLVDRRARRREGKS
jgi:hypothetical protein